MNRFGTNIETAIFGSQIVKHKLEEFENSAEPKEPEGKIFMPRLGYYTREK